MNQSFKSDIAIIGGSGFYSVSEQSSPIQQNIDTPYSDVATVLYGERVGARNIWFIPRHGKEHTIAPHLINYRANLWALNQLGVKKIIAVNAVGGINENMGPGQIVIPTQILDYTWGRNHTYFDGLSALENHIDFSWPYDSALSELLVSSTQSLGISHLGSGVYACTQGPRLETAAEIVKLKNDGADIVGMTGMPEAALARELDIAYSSIAIVVNWGAGITDTAISMSEIVGALNIGVQDARKIITMALPKL